MDGTEVKRYENMDEELRKRIWEAVDEVEKNPKPLKDIKLGLGYSGGEHSGMKYQGTYWENYHIIKSLDLGHRPTKEETNECMFYAVAKLIGKGDADKGIKKVLSQFEV